MAAKRLSMRKIREVLRLKYELGFTHRTIAKALRVAVGTEVPISTNEGFDYKHLYFIALHDFQVASF